VNAHWIGGQETGPDKDERLCNVLTVI